MKRKKEGKQAKKNKSCANGGFGPAYSSDDAGDGPEYVEWGDQLVTKRQMKLILANSEKWEFYLQLKVTNEDWWSDPERIYKVMEKNMSAEYFEIFREDVEKGRIGDIIGFHDFLRGFENSPLGVQCVAVEKLTRRQESIAHGADWDFFVRCTGGSWTIGAWELLAKMKMMDKTWGEKEMQEVVDIVAEEFKREVRDEDFTFHDFVRLRTKLWRRRRARQELRRAWQRLREIVSGGADIIARLEMEDETNGSDQGSLFNSPKFESMEVPMVVEICWKHFTKVSRKGRRVGKGWRRYEREGAGRIVRVTDRSKEIKKKPMKSSRGTCGRSIVKKIWKVRGRRKKRMRRRIKALKRSKPWKAMKSKAILIGRAAKIGFGHRKRELHGLRPQEAWLAWTSARDGVG
jgi:hypothetical protein